MIKNAKIVIISSVSGGGKTTLIQLLRKKFSYLHLAITATTRKPRNFEKDSVDYFFYSKDDFLKKIEKNDFLEYAVVHGNYYGVPSKPVKKKIEKGVSVLLNIDVQGMKTVMTQIEKKQLVTIFIKPPDKETWIKRLRGRNTDTDKQILERIEQGEWEMKQSKDYDYVIINDRLEKALEELIEIFKENKLILE